MYFLRYQQDEFQAVEYGWMERNEIFRIHGDPFSSYRRGEYVAHIDHVILHAPVIPSKIIGIGRNYYTRDSDFSKAKAEIPTFFFKPPSAIIGPEMPIVLPALSEEVEFAAELGVVIGRPCRNVLPQDALQYIFGYTCANDVSARDVQRRDGSTMRAKSFDTFLPLGPWIAQQVDPVDLLVISNVNSQIRQMSSSRDMRWSVVQLISYLSSIMTLMPGDVVLTGTPLGNGLLQEGDYVEVDIEGVGSLRNPVIKQA